MMMLMNCLASLCYASGTWFERVDFSHQICQRFLPPLPMIVLVILGCVAAAVVVLVLVAVLPLDLLVLPLALLVLRAIELNECSGVMP